MTPQPTLEEPRTQGQNKVMNETKLMKLSPMDVPATVTMEDPTQFVGSLMKSVLDRGITQESVGAVRELVGLFEKMDAKRAEQKFNAAFVQLQKEMPNITKTKIVPTKTGGVKFKFAPLEDLMKKIQPVAERNGFAISFGQTYEEQRIIQTCTLLHVGGHSKSASFACRIGGGYEDGLTNAQIDTKASTSAKRGALCSILNIVTEADFEDPHNEGAFITKDQAADLERRAKACGADEGLFLKFADAKTYGTIRQSKYSTVDASLRKKEKTV